MKLSPELVQVLVTFLISGGLTALIAKSIQGISTLRTGARASVREVVKDLAASRDEAEERLNKALRDLEFWRTCAGGYMFQMTQAGLRPDPASPRPPSALVDHTTDQA